MLITDNEKLLKIQQKMTLAPEVRRVTVTQEGNLLVEGNRKLLFTDYLAFGLRGSYWKLGSEHYPPDGEMQEAVPLGLITERKLLLNAPFGHHYYISPSNPPQEDDYFMLLILAAEFGEFIYLDGNMKTPLRLLLHPNKQDQLIGLAITLTKQHDNALGERLRYCFEQEVTSRGKK